MEHVASVVKESVLDYVQDVRLARQCGKEVRIYSFIHLFVTHSRDAGVPY